MINFKNGACVDTRTEKQKEKDYNIKEVHTRIIRR